MSCTYYSPRFRYIILELTTNEFSALEDSVLPLVWPVKSADGKGEVKEVLVPKGTDVVVSILSANRSKKIWGEDAEVWKPSRWLEPLPESISKAHLPGVYSQM